MPIALKEIEGSNVVAAHGYDLASQTLAIRFKSGAVHHYLEVPPEAADLFGKADSLGRHFGAHIRGKFTSVPVLQDAAVDSPQP